MRNRAGGEKERREGENEMHAQAIHAHSLHPIIFNHVNRIFPTWPWGKGERDWTCRSKSR